MGFDYQYSHMTPEKKSFLHDLGLKYKCDKCWVKCFCCPLKVKCSKKTSYLYNYEKFINKNSTINILEIGVRDGASMKIQNEYLSHESNIIGIDINPKCNQCKDLNNVNVIIGDCNNKETINKILKMNLNFNCILDDGSHYYKDITDSINFYYPLLKINGIYIIEDLATMNRISNKNINDLKIFIKNNLTNYKLYEYPEMIIIEKI